MKVGTDRRFAALDPGVRGCGVALYDWGELVACGYVPNPAEWEGDAQLGALVEMGVAVDVWVEEHWPEATRTELSDPWSVVFEWPQVYTAGKLRGDPNDLLPLAGIGMWLWGRRGLDPGHARYRPAEWKGQLPTGGKRGAADVVEARVRGRLGAEELRVLEAGLLNVARSLRHNVVDAVGIGLHHLGRFERRRVIAR